MADQGGASDKPCRRNLSADLTAVGCGDRDAFRRVYQDAAGKLFALILRITGNRSGAEDVLQETFIKVWNRAPGFDPGRADGMAWLAKIARNSAIDWYRAHHRRTFIGGDAVSFVVDEAESSEHRIIHEQEELRALKMLEELPREQEGEIRSVYLLGLTYAELAELKGLPVNTLKSRIRRALLALRHKLEND